MRKIILYSILFATFIGKIHGQLGNFYPISEEVSQNDLGVVEVGPNTFEFDADNYLNAWNTSGNAIEFAYLWSFGDGQYSTEQKPEHTYASGNDIVQYQVVLYATPIYIPLGPPPAIYLPAEEFIEIHPGVEPPPLGSTYMQPWHQEINLSYNRLPRGSYESTFILTYKNKSGIAASFPVHFDFNETYFEYKGIVAPAGEQFDPNTGYSSISTNNYTTRLTFTNPEPLEPNEERTIFIQMKALPEVMGEMETESNGEVELENPPELFAKAEIYYANISALYDDEITFSAVSSWDPNNKISSIQYINRDAITFPQTIRYRINCENVGNGPTSSVRIIDHVSPYLDITSFNLVDHKLPGSNNIPSIVTDPSNGTVSINFSNLVLQGTNSPNFTNVESCQYWVDIEYDIKPTVFNSHFGSSSSPCSSTGSLGTFGTGAEIIFDDHTPILTNIASTEVFCEVVTGPPLEITNVFPNPVEDLVNVTYVISNSSESIDINTAQTYLIDVNSGGSQEIFNVALDDTEGTHQVQLDLSFASPGSYVFQIQVSGLIFTSSTIVKQ